MILMKQGLTVEKLAEIKAITGPVILPDGSTVAYTLGTMNLKENRTDTDIYTVTPGLEPTKLTDTGKAGSPAWSPDGQWIAYTQGEEKGKSIWVMHRDGAYKRKLAGYEVSNASLGVGTVGDAIRWSPDGSRIAFLATLEPYDKDAKIRVIDRLMFKSFYGPSDMRRRHVFTVPVTGAEPPRQHTYGDSDEHSINWTQDGGILYVSNTSGLDDYNMKLDIHKLDPETGETVQLTDTPGATYHPTPSPEGKWIAYLATTRPDTSNESTPEDTHLWVMNSDGTGQRDLTEELDRHVSHPPVWTRGGGVLFTAYNHGRNPVYRATTSGEVQTVRDGERSYGDISTADGVLAYTVNDPATPSDLYTFDGEETRLTRHNDIGLSLPWPEEFWFTTSDNHRIQGWIYKPPDFNPADRYPALLSIKGGPSGMRGYSWNPGLQAPTTEGFVQVVINYRGSSGYGDTFSDAVIGDMLGGEYRDNMEALDHIIETRGYVDPDRLGVWGGSYGGYLTNWTITQTHRFKAAVSISSISNLWSQWACSAIPLWLEVEIEGKPWEKPELMHRQSPIYQAHKARTPTMFLHGEQDFDTPICEAEQFFMVLKKMGVEARMVRYVDDGHGVGKKPVNKLDSLRRTIAWFKAHL